jgi:hypothetical protein
VFQLGMTETAAPVSIFGRGDLAMNDGQQPSDAHLREIAEKIRELARQTPIPEAREELLDLADDLDRMAQDASKSRE